jgi:hypothetical protein
LIKAVVLLGLVLAAAPPVLALKSVTVAGERGTKVVRFATPRHWTAEEAIEPRSVRLVGPDGEGEITILVATSPAELGTLLTRLKSQHPGAQPSPPAAMKVAGIDPIKGERATRFIITGRELGEMVLIERGGAIVLFATIVEPDAWKDLSKIMARCYPTVAVEDAEARK